MINKKYIIVLTTALLLSVAYLGTQLNLPFMRHASMPTASAAQVDYFLKIDGIDGESTDQTHPGAITLDSWSWGETNSSSHGFGGGLGAGKVKMEEFHFTMKTSKASPKLMLAVANGEHFKKATLTARKAGGDPQDYLTITLSDVLVSSYHINGNGNDIIPTDQITLAFSKIEFEYKPQNSDGTLGSPVKTEWDLKTNGGTIVNSNTSSNLLLDTQLPN